MKRKVGVKLRAPLECVYANTAPRIDGFLFALKFRVRESWHTVIIPAHSKLQAILNFRMKPLSEKVGTVLPAGLDGDVTCLCSTCSLREP